MVTQALIKTGEQCHLCGHWRPHRAAGDLGCKPFVEDVEFLIGFVEIEALGAPIGVGVGSATSRSPPRTSAARCLG